MKEPELKLFGMKIMLPEKTGIFDELKLERAYEEHQEAEEYYESPLKKKQNPDPPEESQNTTTSSSGSDDNPKTPSIDETAANEDHTKNENDENDPRQKALKKPDKILPCPRCNSMDTKFCYYNNYNVNQPRHFCKSCQRYWTAGGTMRNVPVGAGRRKNKNSVPQYRHITISEALTGIDVQNGFHHQSFKPNGTVLSFGPDSPMCESTNSGSSLAEKRDDSSANGGKNEPQQPITPQSKNNGVHVQSHVPFIPGVPWSFPWSPTMPLTAICPPGYPMPFYPPPYWNCGVPNAWNVPWIPIPSPVLNQQTSTASNPNSPLGKHSRNGDLISPNNQEKKEQSDANQSGSSIVVPKTLRFDDPDEAAKSSIWSTLGIKYDSVSREGFFKSLQPKGDEKKGFTSSSLPMHANPAALSRSLNFQERV